MPKPKQRDKNIAGEFMRVAAGLYEAASVLHNGHRTMEETEWDFVQNNVLDLLISIRMYRHKVNIVERKGQRA